ncbi:MAG: acyltransferase [Zoogloeaceae bacterium]|jgi:peptidoglycan/LPS O-acetylase OafA/YrhL|nr:acyltransferase [Zoogloeaceae bacterium]
MTENYRPDIDGLRAIAVLAVVIHHVSPSLLPGGFLGVDVFFVISGYLISRIILGELQNGSFRFSRFYARRVRRLFPALLTVLSATLIFGAFALFAHEYAQLSRHAFWSIAFLENFRLMGEMGYFDAASYAKPLMHLWSLSVEEQFYLAWPLVLFLTWRTQKRNAMKAVLVPIAFFLTASWLFTLYMGKQGDNALYFHPFGRVWELLLGAALARLHTSTATAYSGVGVTLARFAPALSLVGLAALCVGMWLHKWNIAYPGWMTLIPVLGAALLIACRENCLANRLLALKPLVWIGLVSYPLYLWHWPILSCIRIMESGSPAREALWAGALLAVLLAALTWRFIEQPIRRASTASPKRRFALPALCVAMSALFLASCGIVHFDLSERAAQPAHLPTHARGGEQVFPPPEASCLEKFPKNDAPYHCRLRDSGGPMLALIGDSHVAMLFTGVAELASQHGYATIMLANDSCPPLDGVIGGKNREEKELCAKSIDNLFNVPEMPRITHVLIASRGPVYLTNEGFGPDEPEGYWENPVIIPREGNDDVLEHLFRKGLEKTVSRWKARGVQIAYLLQVPELGVPPQDCLTRPLTLTRAKGCRVPYPVYQERMRRYRELVAEIKARHDDLIIIDPEPLFCDKKECSGYRDGQLLYIDDDHLNINGASRVAPLILEAMGIGGLKTED